MPINRFFNNNPKAVFREIVESAGLTPTEDITVGDTKEIFNALKSVDISLMGYTYTLEFEPHDDSLTVKDTASHRDRTDLRFIDRTAARSLAMSFSARK